MPIILFLLVITVSNPHPSLFIEHFANVSRRRAYTLPIDDICMIPLPPVCFFCHFLGLARDRSAARPGTWPCAHTSLLNSASSHWHTCWYAWQATPRCVGVDTNADPPPPNQCTCGDPPCSLSPPSLTPRWITTGKREPIEKMMLLYLHRC